MTTPSTSTPICTALALRAQLDQESRRPTIHPAPAPASIDVIRARSEAWAPRLRALVALEEELRHLDSLAALTAGSRSPELAGAGQWLERVLRSLANALSNTPDLDVLADHLDQVLEARNNLTAVADGLWAGRTRGGAA